ncbi:MAG TPA: hypothetical protein VF841_18860 [Anaeromyxobacter sp.]
MRRISVAAIATTLALAGCPLPQPLPTYPAGTVTPPRILAASTTSGVDSIIPVPAGCATAPSYDLGAHIYYQDSVTVEARWFVDYRADSPDRSTIRNTTRQVPPDPNALILERQVPTFPFAPYGFAIPDELKGNLGASPLPSDPGVAHVVELVVSNGFAEAPGDVQQPNRTPGTTADGTAQFEIQTYRWVFVNVPENLAATCAAGSLGCPKCPP